MKKRWPKQKTARQIKNRVILDMWYMTEKKYNEKMLDLQIRNRQIEIRQNLKAEKNKYRKPFKLPPTSKLVLLTVILLCLEVIVFCEYIALQRGDMRALYALLGLPVTLSPAIWGYYSKAKAENILGGIVYEAAMSERKRTSDEEGRLSE